jgi:hypothetical protein
MSATGEAARTGWDEVLDRLESETTALRAALVDGSSVPVSTWEPPSDLGPLPPELRARADLVLSALADAQRRTRLRLDQLADELAGIDVRRRAGTAYAAG